MALKRGRPSGKAPSTVSVSSQILEAFLSVAFEEGASNVTLEKVASKAKVAFGTVRNYFPAKGLSLEAAAFNHVSAKGLNLLDDHLFKKRQKKDFDPIRAYVDSMFEWQTELPSHTSYWLYCYYKYSTQATMKPGIAEVLGRAWLRTEGLLLEGIGRGLYPQGQNTKELSQKIHITLLGHWMTNGMMGRKNTEIMALAHEAIQSLARAQVTRRARD